jgi:hypothetical protein
MNTQIQNYFKLKKQKTETSTCDREEEVVVDKCY